MDAGLWRRVQQVFAETIELPSEARASFLAAACSGYPELLAEVASLLDAHQRAGGFIEPVPDRVGPYRLIAEIAHGGMGAVYRATRADGQYHQDVAVKLLSIAASPSLYRRFLDEQQILASLSHANIARLLDGGITRSGNAYIVMELVDGVPIDRHAAGLPIDERLRLFRAVCAAVHYAHQNLVVHRDLKPANILVTRDGVAKLLDFGVAKMLAPDGDPGLATVVPAMTPEYASPEQLRGGAVSTASDVYSLGVVLYEMLTARRPYRLEGKTYDEIRRIVCEQPIERPATGSADLDAIICKAMRKDAADRYASAESLSADIDRVLSRHPVEARRGARWYVLQKFIARHRVGVATAALVAVIVAAAVAMTVRQSRLAERRFEDVRHLASSVVFDIHDAVARLPGSTAVRKLIVTDALVHLDRLSEDAAGDRHLQIEIAEAYVRLGDVQGLQSQANLGDASGAIASYQKARALITGIPEASRSDRATLALARASQHLSSVLMFTRREDEAKTHASESVRLLERLVARSPGDAHQSALVGGYNTLSDASGDTSYRIKAVTIAEDLLAKTPNDPIRQRETALIHKYLAAPLVKRLAGDAGLPHLRRAEELDAARVAATPSSREAQLDLSFDYSQNGMYYFNRDQFDAALVNFEQALAIRQRLADTDATDARLRDRLVYVHTQIGRTLLLMHRPADAIPSLEKARHLSEGLLAAEPGHPQYRSNLATAQRLLGDAYHTAGRQPAACPAWQSASRLYAALDRDGQLREAERDDATEVQSRMAICSS